jgi:uncharacterized protein (DUF1499 family)
MVVMRVCHFAIVITIALLQTAGGLTTSNDRRLPSAPKAPASKADVGGERSTSLLLLDLLSRKGFFTTVLSTGALILAGEPSLADDAVAATASYSIDKCNMSSKSPCVSTSNVRQIDLYSPPWTFPSSYNADEIMSRLKGAIVADSTCDIVQQDSNQHLLVTAKRPNDLFGTLDTLEFVVNAQDQVVTFRSSAPEDNTSTDFGLQRRRLDEIRKRAGVFGVMGESMKTADSVTTSERGNGPLGQLKAFYGLQSGGGFEDVLAE